MRILFDSKLLRYKNPFGTLRPDEPCRFHIEIPASCLTQKTELRVLREDGQELCGVLMQRAGGEDLYDFFDGTLCLHEPGLYFYYFVITTANECFRLYKQGNDTNMEQGELWQFSVIAQQYLPPEWAQGAVMYQIFPDRFFRAGECACGDKLRPYSVHENWSDTPEWRPDERGQVLNNDFFGGNLRGIRQKLPYLQSLGVEILYLNPIFMAWSTHRYDTCDYKRIDPMLGTEEDFSALCSAAHGLGMRVILDGVFSHVGSHSPYFQQAAASRNSPYYPWFRFKHWPDQYECWWGITTLPCIDKNNRDYINYIIEDEDSVVSRWLRLGADGWRLDVVDELPDSFVRKLKERIRQVKPDALLIGEVWEDASNKIAYEVRRRYFVDNELDSVMNYPWQKAILRFVRGEEDGSALGESLMTLAENYPPQILNAVMNILSTHDTPRAVNALVHPADAPREELAGMTLSQAERELGKKRLKMAAFLQFTLPGMACIYYGDEAGMTGWRDPFNRCGFIWGQEDGELTGFYRALARLKKQTPALRSGTMTVSEAGQGRLMLLRKTQQQTAAVCCNRSQQAWTLPIRGKLLFGAELESCHSEGITLSAGGYAVIEISQ